MADKKNSNTAAPANADLTGLSFLYFGKGAVRRGVVLGALAGDRWLLEFHAGPLKFSNVFSAAALESFVFMASREQQDLFMADLEAQQKGQTPRIGAIGRGQSAGGG